jgi:hypothetical protein
VSTLNLSSKFRSFYFVSDFGFFTPTLFSADNFSASHNLELDLERKSYLYQGEDKKKTN